MSQFFTGIPIGRKRVLFVDLMLVLVIGLALSFVGISNKNYTQISFGLLLIALAVLNPIRMSAVFPTSVLMLWDDEEEEKQQNNYH